MKQYGILVEVRHNEFSSDRAWLVVLAVSEKDAILRGHSFLASTARIVMSQEWLPK
ncbi:MAG: hypothetical protein NUW01_09030 [Gemmatimonadaceae bacterium]|nr:hypothetical protein [Gemmatimonadaceae bacterium]